MANKYTITVNATITSDKPAHQVMTDVYAAIEGIGSNCIVQQTNCNQWVDQVNSKPQVFNADGTPRVEEADVEDIVETAA